jgi:hypothetical protein
MLTGLVGGVLAVAAGGAITSSHAQPQPPTGWDGSNPFRCVLQQAGQGTVVPDPGADPYCVEFDKRRQNVSELGVVEFLSLEPARVAAAGLKCFYFQSDHWRGSLVQDDGSTKTYEFDGHYFFDKARGEGGAWVTNFNIGGQSFDPSTVPGIPPEFAAQMGPGTAGVITRNDLRVDPACVARAADAAHPVYASAPAGSELDAPGTSAVAPCPSVTGTATGAALGPIRLGDPDARVRAVLGAPQSVHRGYLRYCAGGGDTFLVGQRGGRSGAFGADPDAPTAFLFTTSAAIRVAALARGRGGVGPGTRAAVVRRAFPQARVRTRMGRTVVWETRRGSRVLLGVRAGRVRYVAVHDRRAVRTLMGIRSFLRRVR